MSLNRIYLDNNATTRPLPEVQDSMLDVFRNSFANASSAHSFGRKSLKLIVSARDSVANLVEALPEQVIFTSSGTEANNQVLMSCELNSQVQPHIVTSVVEHSSILKMCEHLEASGIAEVTYLPVNSSGLVSIEDLKNSLTNRTSLVSIQWVNNETGVIQDVATIGGVCQDVGVLFHSDVAQALGKIEIDFAALSADFITFTAHKIHGPQGVGGIVVRDAGQISPLLYGGSQELGLRPGTENLAGIVGFGVAVSLRRENFTGAVDHTLLCRDQFENRLLETGIPIVINGGVSRRVCNTSNIQFKGVEGLALFAQLDARGVICSQSSACTNQRPEPSYVLKAMGLSEDEAYASVRFCFSQDNTLDEVRRAVFLIKEIYENLGNGW